MGDKSQSIRGPGGMIAVGSQVVLLEAVELRQENGHSTSRTYRKAGSVAVIRECPPRTDGGYLLEFSNGEFGFATARQLTLRRREIDDLLEAVETHTFESIQSSVIYRCVVGSRAFGLADESSDEDVRGIYLAPAELHWSLYRTPPQVDSAEHGSDEVYWELEKFLRLALKANPNILETLWTPHVSHADDIALELLEMRHAFLSKHLYKTYSGYVLSQFRRVKNAMARKGAFKPKHAMHLIRLMISGTHALRTGEILLDVGEHREDLLAIRRGETSAQDLEKQLSRLDAQFQEAFRKTTLPDQPDVSAVNDFLIRARRHKVRDYDAKD